MFNWEKIKNILKEEPAYRLKQIKRAVFVDFISAWQEAVVLPKNLREKLEAEHILGVKAETFVSEDGKTVKALIGLADGLKIETVLMRHGDNRNTICVSSQVGCPLGCEFCATGKMGFKRNLEISEIVGQVLFFARNLKKQNEKITNIVFMGMGEPFLNYENVLGAIRLLNDHEGFNLGARHFSVSTAGIVEEIERLAEEGLQINLAISLHAADNDLRLKLMPINKKYPLEKIFAAVKKYVEKTKRRVMFEYVMIKGVNDADADALKLIKLIKNNPLYFVNLISYNPTGVFNASSSKRIKEFREIIEKAGVKVTQRYRFGEKIKGACGQLLTSSS